MADQAVGELIRAQSIGATDLFVLEQGGVAKSLTGQILLNWLTAAADGHGGIQNIQKVSTSGLVDTYRITLADTTFIDIPVTNGRSITGVSKTGTSGLVDTHTIIYNDGTTSTFTVTNGEKGDKGDNAYTWVKYASQEPTESSHSMGDIPDDWIGIYSGNASTAPTDWKQYQWFKYKGEKGDTGSPATLESKSVTYQVSDSGTIIPSGPWGSSVPVVPQGKYLWTKTEVQFNTGDPIVYYVSARQGVDGSGSVSSVNNVSPDADGNVALTAPDVGALPTTGGEMTGELRMNGQPISGLNDPTEGTQAAPKSYVDKRVPLDGSQAMTGNLPMGGNRITDLAEPEDDEDAATKGYADTKASLPKTASGTVIALSDASYGPLQGLRIYGRTTQDGTPTPDNPVPLVSVGDGGSISMHVSGLQMLYPALSLLNGPVSSGGITATLGSDGNIVLNGTSTGNVWIPVGTFTAIEGKTYTVYRALGVSISIWSETQDYYINRNTEYFKFTATKTEKKVVVVNEVKNLSVSNFNLNAAVFYGDVENLWEPYTGQTLPISTPNGLPGIPVTSGGNYTDADGQQWICDEVDFARGVYVQRIIRRKIVSSDNFASHPEQRRYWIDVDGLNVGITDAFCTHFVGADSWLNSMTTDGTFIVYRDSGWNSGRISFKIAAVSSLDAWKQFLDSNEVYVIYKPAEPIETPIPAEELAAYAALHTNKPNTTIYNDAGAYMDVGYYPPDATMRQEDIMEYVDAKHFLATVSLPAESWTGDAAPYIQTVPVSGILATDFPHVTPVYSSTLATALAQKEAWSMVNQGVPGAGEITFTCFDDKPATEIPIQIEVMR